ncbi:MAG: alpha/beta hydrolase [bacterium]|nr:alpha/beta hydrolase [bacterium]
MSWTPQHTCNTRPILFVPGWISVIEGWLDLLGALIPTRPIFYLETREKQSALIPKAQMKAENFSILRLAEDLVEVWRQIGFTPGEADLFGSSMGSNAILEALKHGKLPARSAFLIGPNSEFFYPWWSWVILSMPTNVYPALRSFVLWYLRNFRVDARAEPEQYQRYTRTLNAAHPLRLKLSAIAIKHYSVWDSLASIQAPVGFAYATTDILHGEDSILSMVNALPKGHAIKCASNTYMHTAGVTKELDLFLSQIIG